MAHLVLLNYFAFKPAEMIIFKPWTCSNIGLKAPPIVDTSVSYGLPLRIIVVSK